MCRVIKRIGGKVMKVKAASILIVSDDKSTRDWLGYCLWSDYQCTLSVNAEQALKLLADQRFNLVITNLSMPGISGFDLCRTIKQKWPDTIVLIIAGAADSRGFSESPKAGAFAFLPQPVDLVWLNRTIKLALNG